MSIINEALRKANREKHESSSGKPLGGGILQSESLKRKKQINWGPVFLFLVFGVITGPIVAPVFTSSFRHVNSISASAVRPVGHVVRTSEPVVAEAEPSKENRKGQFGVEEFSAVRPLPLAIPNLNLTGIVYSEPNSYCIINNKIVKKGEFIQGAQLVSVTGDEAVLDYQGQRISLATTQ